jgi:hypothetical protein
MKLSNYVFAVCAASLMSVSYAVADPVSIYFNVNDSGNNQNFSAPNYSGDWVVATFTQVDSTHVNLTVSTAGLPSGERVDELGFNLPSGVNYSDLSFQNPTSFNSTYPTGVSQSGGGLVIQDGQYNNNFKLSNSKNVDGVGSYGLDINLTDTIFLGGGLSTAFTATLYDANGLSNNFLVSNGATTSGYYAVAHVTQVDPNAPYNPAGAQSGYIIGTPTPEGAPSAVSTPEPSRIAGLFGIAVTGLVGLVWSRRRLICA